MISEPLRRLEAELRRETVSHSYKDVERLVRLVCATAAGETGRLAAGDSRILEIAAWVDNLLEWTRVMLTTARAVQAAELRQAYFVQGYLPYTNLPARTSLDL